MRKTRKLIAMIAVVGIMGTAGTAFAATANSPAEIVSGLTGKSVEALDTQRTAGTTYGTIAKDAGKLDEFQAQMLEQKKLILDQRVANKVLTQAQADEIYNDIKDNQAICDGTGLGNGAGRGNGMGQGMGFGSGMGRGAGNGGGSGLGAGNGLNR